MKPKLSPNVDVVATEYCITLSTKEMLALLDYDNSIYNTPLVYTLKGVVGVKDIEYEGYYGPHIYLTIDADCDTKETWKKIFKIIRNIVSTKEKK